jgi:hypothetical protein
MAFRSCVIPFHGIEPYLSGNTLSHHYFGLHRVLRRVFGPKRDEVTGEWRKLHKEELRNL